MIRKAAFAGSFYPSERGELRHRLEEMVPRECPHQPARALLVPHAGYEYSGHIAGRTYASVDLPRRFVLLCPNHTGTGAPLSIQSMGRWETPLGEVEIDRELAEAIKKHCMLVQDCPSALRREHSAEVQLPFLQHLLDNDFRFVPISVGTGRLETLLELGRGLADAVREVREPVLLVATSDMSHFEPAETTEAKDRLAIERICQLDGVRLHKEVQERPISMCGYGPAIAAMEASRRLGAREGELVGYAHSGEVSGEHSSVVGYAGVVIH